MPRDVREHPTELEFQMLRLLWEESPLTARQIRNLLAQRGRDLAHTSVITTLQKMVGKGQIAQLPPDTGKAFRFAPLLNRDDTSQSMLGELLDRVFDGSAEAVMLKLFEVSDLDGDALRRMRRALNRKMKEQQQ